MGVTFLAPACPDFDFFPEESATCLGLDLDLVFARRERDGLELDQTSRPLGGETRPEASMISGELKHGW